MLEIDNLLHMRLSHLSELQVVADAVITVFVVIVVVC